jgi:hypothetical protein
MPLDSAMYDPLGSFKHRAIWYLKFAWLPRRCCISGERIWLKKAYKGTAMWTGPGEPVFQHEWVTKEEYLFARLKGQL